MTMHMSNRFMARGLTSPMSHELTDDEIRRYAPSVFQESAHESRSERYKVIPTARIVDGMRKAGFLPFSVKQASGTGGEHAKHMIRFRYVGTTVETAGLGGLIPEVVLINSHDGSSSYQLMSGMFRVLCLNGLIAKSSDFDCIRVSHTGNIEDKVIEGSYRVIESSVKAIEAPKQWAQIELKQPERMAFAKAAHHLRFADADGKIATPIEPAQLLHINRAGDSGDDLWKTFNVVQENALRGGLTARTRHEPGQRGRRVTMRQINGIDQDVKLNRALWVLAEEMAKAKAA